MSRLRWPLMILVAALLIVPPSPSRAQVSDKAYIIGPEDVLEIQVWERKDLNQTVFVRPDGRTSLPLVGEILVAGKTVQELQDHLAKVYDKTSQSAVVTVIVREIKSRPVYVVGVVPGDHGERLRAEGRQAHRGGLLQAASEGRPQAEHPARARRHGGRPG